MLAGAETESEMAFGAWMDAARPSGAGSDFLGLLGGSVAEGLGCSKVIGASGSLAAAGGLDVSSLLGCSSFAAGCSTAVGTSFSVTGSTAGVSFDTAKLGSDLASGPLSGDVALIGDLGYGAFLIGAAADRDLGGTYEDPTAGLAGKDGWMGFLLVEFKLLAAGFGVFEITGDTGFSLATGSTTVGITIAGFTGSLSIGRESRLVFPDDEALFGSFCSGFSGVSRLVPKFCTCFNGLLGIEWEVRSGKGLRPSTIMGEMTSALCDL